ncbi:MAG: CBS domain-containing protein [Gammaproteobacteria bacterium]|nr:MAG: CBS domain-containing protein [Gammaproteobacteria bacterium]
MGEHQVHDTSDEQRTRTFVRAMLDDIRALEIMIERDMIEGNIQRVGVEQEMYIVNAQDYPAPVSDRVLKSIGDPRFSTELARFNLEANLDPSPIGGDFLRAMEAGLNEVLLRADHAANAIGDCIVLTGILPTLQESHVTLDALTPEVRYQCLNDTCMAVRGDRFTLVIDGIDPFESSHDCAVVEGASTSFQFHLQVTPETAGPLYNLAQLITAPILAAAANSPVLFNRRVWHETRVALFERTFEYRSTPQLARDFPTRVGFGEAWVKDSILEVFRENAMRHNVIMVRDSIEDPFAALDDGRIPDLSALALHNGTVWRWNRPCYGITDGKPHLRIENRALPAGPTTVDQVANVALYYGLMQALENDAVTIPQRLTFEDARLNLFAAAQHGLAARFSWLDGHRTGARELLLHDLIPTAREGLRALQVPTDDIDYYLGIIEDRVESGRTGARWLLDSLANVPEAMRAAICKQAVQIVHQRQARSVPVHRWDLISPDDAAESDHGMKRVGDIMTTNLFTVRPEDLIDLATSMMEWRHMRHVPVETASGELVGLLSPRELLRLRSSEIVSQQQPMPVSEIMRPDPATISPDATLKEAFAQIFDNDAGCLLVVAQGQLLGIITERDLLQAAIKQIPGSRE